MKATPRPHFEEIDWLDYVQGDVDLEQRRDRESHLADCAQCRATVKSLERLARALPTGLCLVEDDGQSAASAESCEALVAAARERAEEKLSSSEVRRQALLSVFADESCAGADIAWTPALLDEAHPLCRELLRTDVELAGRMLRSALAFLDFRGASIAKGLAASLRASFAYVRVVEGKVEEGLAALDRVHSVLETEVPVPEVELGFWHYVRATALYNLSRPEEALPEIRSAESIYEMLDDPGRLARCRQIEAVLLSNLGNPEASIEVYGLLLGDPSSSEDQPLYAGLLVNYGNDLVNVGRLSEAKATYARAIDLLKKTGQERLLFRVRTGLAKIADQEGRWEDALAIMVALRPQVRALSIAWEEVLNELRIAEMYLKLEKPSEAAEICRALLPRIEESGFEREAEKALKYLVEAERNIDLARLGHVQRFIQRLENGEILSWSAA
jgi:tetratricopeptide (TPR) repeat protein